MAVTTPSVPASATPIGNLTGQNVDVAVTGGTITGILVLPSPAQNLVAPAVAATGVNVANANTFPVAVTIAANGATITAINVGGVASGLIVGTVVVPAGGTVNIAYTVATPTWTWQVAIAGFAGTSIPSPSSVPLPASGAQIQLIYSAAPTWAWTNPLGSFGYTPGYAGPNQNPINQPGQLPWPQHNVAGVTNLGTGVDN